MTSGSRWEVRQINAESFRWVVGVFVLPFVYQLVDSLVHCSGNEHAHVVLGEELELCHLGTLAHFTLVAPEIIEHKVPLYSKAAIEVSEHGEVTVAGGDGEREKLALPNEAEHVLSHVRGETSQN
jgi:hypothetical protein